MVRRKRISKLMSASEWECPRCKAVVSPMDAWTHPCNEDDPRALEQHHLFTHAGCMDGSGAAILFRHAGGRPENIHWCAPGIGVNQVVEETGLLNQRFTPLLFVDVCPEGEIVERLEQRGNFRVIDHHASAEVHAGKLGFTVSVGNKACGTELFRQHLATEVSGKFALPAYRRLAAVIDDHDRWILSTEFSRQMPRFFAFTGQQEFVERFMDVQRRFRYQQASYWNNTEIELMKLIQNAQDRRHASLLKKFRKRKVWWHDDDRWITVGYLVSGEVNNSELLHRYLAENLDVDLACQINFDHNKVSFRSNDRVDITRFAKRFGGGGHANSGGQPMPDGMTDLVIEKMGHDEFARLLDNGV